MKSVSVVCILIAIATSAYAQNHSVGVRVGTLMTVNYKYYFAKPLAVEFAAGSFVRCGIPIDVSPPAGYIRVPPLAVERSYTASGRFLYQQPLREKFKGRLDVYCGAGAFYVRSTMDAHYEQISEPYNVENERVNVSNIGFEAIGGMDYRFEKAPVILFGEIFFMRTFLEGAYHYTSGGIGARYIF